jgi:endonuclease/exonuclease/phosphatase (EEP) superfamily protein YafD
MYESRKYVFLIMALSFFFSCSNVEQRQRSPSSQELQMELPSHFNVLIWNSYKGVRRSFSDELTSLLPTYDLVLLQEAQDNSFFTDLFESRDHFTTSFAHSWGRNGVLTASRASIIQAIPLKSMVRELYIATPKSALITTHPVRDDQGEIHSLLVINIHMINFRETNAVRKQLEEYRSYIESHDGPIIVGGDFNTWNQFRRRVVMEFFEGLGLTEISYLNEDNLDPRSKLIVGVLDRVFQKGLEVIETKVYDEIDSSDHYPFSAKLRVIQED